MRKTVTTLLVFGLMVTLFAMPALAGLGGHDETMETYATGWNAGTGSVATPGTVAAGITGTHLLFTEVGWRGLNNKNLADSVEFIEIYNPTALPIVLTNYYVSDVNGYSALPVAGTINLALNSTDFGMKFPNGAQIGPGAVKVIAIDGGRWKRGVGTDADFMLFNAGGGATTALPMVDVHINGGAIYPTYGELLNTGEFVWLFNWNGLDDLVGDVDLETWGTQSGDNFPLKKTAALCQDGPDVGVITSCYRADLGPIVTLATPSNGSGTRQRIGPEVGETATGGNGYLDITVPAIHSTWGSVKAIYR